MTTPPRVGGIACDLSESFESERELETNKKHQCDLNESCQQTRFGSFYLVLKFW